jgi:hypothetical protein
MGFTILEKIDMVLIYGEARGHAGLAWQIYGERFPQRSQCTNVVQHFRDFGRFDFDMNKCDLGR